MKYIYKYKVTLKCKHFGHISNAELISRDPKSIAKAFPEHDVIECKPLEAVATTG